MTYEEIKSAISSILKNGDDVLITHAVDGDEVETIVSASDKIDYYEHSFIVHIEGDELCVLYTDVKKVEEL